MIPVIDSCDPMVTATFEFHGDLNDFLRPAHRHCVVECTCAEAATSKHMIEALGVPHTEVGCIHVNNERASLHHLLREGDRVVVDAIASLQRPVEEASVDAMPRFLADAHLGGLARWLRMAGFDTVYDNALQDDEIVRIGSNEGRIILTRDRELLKRRTVVSGGYIRALLPAEQMKEALARFGLAPHVRPFTLCLHCNLPLAPVDKACVLERLPPSVQRCQDEFSCCACCQRVYWKGSHWQRMHARLHALVAEAESTVVAR